MHYCEPLGLSYYHNPGQEPLHYHTIGQLVKKAVAKWPNTDVFVSVQDNTRLTFTQADEQSSRLAAGFLELGLEPGDRIAICSPNSAQWFLTALAAYKAGLILVPMNPSLMAKEVEYCLQKVSVRALVTDHSYKSLEYYQMLCDIVPGLNDLPHSTKLHCKKLPNFTFIILTSEKNYPGTFRLCDVLQRCGSLQRLQEVEQRLRPEHNASILFTSGTTGYPKAVPLSHFNIINNAYFIGKRIGLNKKHYKSLAQAPFFHVLGLLGSLMLGLNFGTTIVLPSRTFSALDSSEAIMKEKCTILVGTPTMYIDLCSYVSRLSCEEQVQHKSVEFAVSGGALFLPELFRKMKNVLSIHRVVSLYGLTEVTGAVFQSEPQDSEMLMTSTVGRVSEHVEAKVVDSEGETVPFGTAGELWIRSYSKMVGYWEDLDSTTNLMSRDGWFKTGDTFLLLEGGYGQVVGRMKDTIIRGGENISPKEIEQFLITHPDILDAQVFGVRSERLGEEVGCSLRVKPDTEVTEEEVKNFCKGKIAHFKIPKYMEFMDEFPKTGSGKVQKFRLRELMEIKLGLSKQL